MLTLLLTSMLTLAFSIQLAKAEPRTWTVDDSGGADFTTIQDAIIAASPSDTIFVYNGIYYERLYVNKENLTIRGESKSNTIIDGGGFGAVIRVWKDKVVISGFTVRNGGWGYYYMAGSGIFLDYVVKSCVISDNIVKNCRYGISQWLGRNNIISGNTISNAEHGVSFDTGHHTTVVSNTILDTEIGINLHVSNNNTIVGNTISNSTSGGPNWGGGIYLYRSNNNTVAFNKISNTTEVGIWQYYSSYNTIADNVISQNPDIPMQYSSGVHIGDFSYHNNVLNNDISKSLVGIYVSQIVGDNNIVGNTIANLTSYMCGINVWGPNNRVMGNTITKMGYVGIQLNSISSDGQYGTPNACANNLVKGNTILDSTFGINLILAAPSNTIEANNVSNNGLGILIADHSDNNIIITNFVSNNYYGILLFSSDNTKVYHNNFIKNTQQVLLSGSLNTKWDDGYPSGGNYWSDYTDADLYTGPNQDMAGSDGIWDQPYIIDSDSDRYPLTEPWSAPAMMKTLIRIVRLQGLPKGTESSLTSKLYEAIHLLNIDNENGATHKLMEFIDQVKALRNKKITNEQADYLISEARRIIELIKE